MHDQVSFSSPLLQCLSFMFISILIFISHESRRSRNLLLSLAPFGKEKSAVSIVLESFGNMHSGVQEQPKNKGMYCTGSGIREGRYPSRRGSFCIFSHLSSCIPLFFLPLVARFVFYFPDTNGVLQRVAVTASHLQVNEASVREGRDLASLL